MSFFNHHKMLWQRSVDFIIWSAKKTSIYSFLIFHSQTRLAYEKESNQRNADQLKKREKMRRAKTIPVCLVCTVVRWLDKVLDVYILASLLTGLLYMTNNACVNNCDIMTILLALIFTTSTSSSNLNLFLKPTRVTIVYTGRRFLKKGLALYATL